VTNHRVIIADDEPLARERIRHLLVPHKAYEVVAECADGGEAVEAIEREKPDLVFLDIRMPALDGFEVLAALDADRRPAGIVFVTAFDEYAIRAFDESALDYLRKPFDRDRFDRTLQRVEARLAKATMGLDDGLRRFLETLRARDEYPARFAVRGATGIHFVRAADVDWIDAQGNYVRLHAGGKAHLLRATMKAFEARLDPRQFVRVHRSAIVNIDHIDRVEAYSHGEYLITLRGGERILSSRGHSGALHQLLG
jgi:two-component system LytT family response regulator